MERGAVAFGPFRLIAAERLLLEGDKPVRLGSRAFDILATLVERAGEVVGKDELMARVWPQTFVEESNLKIQVSALRRALGDGQGGHRYVVTVPGRGYNFVAPVDVGGPSRAAVIPAAAPSAVHNLPPAATRMIGRDDAVAALVSRLAQRRLITIVGPGGIGKTTLALSVAERLIGSYEHGVWVVDLAPLADQHLVATAVATVLGLRSFADDPLPGLIASLKGRRMLLVLDNCDHLIDATASLTAAVLNGAPTVNILATSREPIGVPGEREYRLGPLGMPLPSARMAAEVADFPAVRLFVERVTATVEDFALTDANAPVVVDICRRLDGLPLAIEFAAPRVAVLGIEGLAARLDDSLPLLETRHRIAMPRHRTMRAVLDWSYGLLSTDEQQFFRSLGIFAGHFSVEAAAAVAADATKSRPDTIDRLADLVSKSLVIADVSGAKPRFRLLETSRAYALEKLDESGERERIAARHGEYFRQLFRRAEEEAATRPTGEWLPDYVREIDNLRAALDWAFSPGGDASIGVALAAAATPLLMRLSLHVECRSRALQALAAIESGTTSDPRDEMRLQAALGAASPVPAEVNSGFMKALDIAESLGDLEYKLRALSGRFYFHSASGQHRAAFPFAQRVHVLAMREADPSAQLFAEHIMGMAEHFLGNQIPARCHLEQVLTRYATDTGLDDIRFQNAIRFQIDAQVSTHAFLARVLWLQGLCDQSLRAAGTSIEKAQASGHALSLCYALALAACPIAFWMGNLAAAARYTEMLLDNSRKHNLPLWSAYGSRFQRVLALRRGGPDAGLRRHDHDMETIQPDSNFGFFTGLGELAEALLRAGRIDEALSVVEAGIERSEADWLRPELLRLKGVVFKLPGGPAAVKKAEDLFRQALDMAQRQDALSWELRAATSLARLLCDQGRPAEAIACLQPVYDRFTEGFETADLIEARRLLATPG